MQKRNGCNNQVIFSLVHPYPDLNPDLDIDRLGAAAGQVQAKLIFFHIDPDIRDGK